MHLKILGCLRRAAVRRVLCAGLMSGLVLAGTPSAFAQESGRGWTSSVTTGTYDTQAAIEEAIRAVPGYEKVDSIHNTEVGEGTATSTYWQGTLYPEVTSSYSGQGAASSTEEGGVQGVLNYWNAVADGHGCTNRASLVFTGEWSRDEPSPTAGRYYLVYAPSPPARADGTCPRIAWPGLLSRTQTITCPADRTFREGTCQARVETPVTVRASVPLACDDCSLVGNPIDVSTGDKFETEQDFVLPWITWTRYYHSASDTVGGALGRGWTHSHNTRLSISSGATPTIALLEGSGRQVAFRQIGDAWESTSGNGDRVTRMGQAWLLHRSTSVLTFDVGGLLVREDFPDATSLTYTYSRMQKLLHIQHSSGRSLRFTYVAGPLRGDTPIAEIHADELLLARYAYGPKRQLLEVAYGAGADAPSRRYGYGDPRFPYHLTSIDDEQGNRFSTFTYDAKGRALSSQHAGGVNRTTLAYSAAGGASVTDALGHGSDRALTPSAGDGRPRKLSGITESRGTRAITYNDVSLDFRRRVKSVVDYDGTRTDHSYGEIVGIDGVPTIRTHRTVEASGTAHERVSEAHADIATNRLAMRRTAGREVRITRNARLQPTSVLTIEPVTNAQRMEKLTYCESADVGAGNDECPVIGLLRSVDGPRTDTADVTTFSYYPSNAPACATTPAACAYRKGDLWTVTNALGHITETLRYDGAGRPLSVKDANGVITDFEYHPRGWLAARKVRGTDAATEADDAITLVEYAPTGLVKKVTQPDGAFTAYTYDAAHRLTGISDNAGNTITYTLDNGGNRIKEDTKGSSGTLVRTLSRVHDQLGQLREAKDAASRVTAAMTYDAVGNTDTVTDALGTVTDNDYDPLNRLTRTLQDVAGIKAETRFHYDTLDQLTQVTDPKGLDTKYVYDGLGNLTQLTSPDTGITTYTYDAAGNRRTQTDARAVTTSYAYDALNRVASVRYPTSGLNITYAYDRVQAGCDTGEKYSAGRMTRMTDSSGYTQYCHDPRGNVVRKIQASSSPGAKALTTRYAYNVADRLVSVVYPSGMRVDYTHNMNGRPSGVSVTDPGKPTEVLLAGVSYHPFGPPSELEYGNGRLLKRSLNLDYQPGFVEDTQAGGLSLGYEFDPAGNMVGLRKGDQSDPSLRTFGYDALGRLTAAKDGTSQSVLQSYAYDATGNRTRAENSGATTAYTYASSDHRLQRVGASTRTYDAAGNTLSIGGAGKSFVYNDTGRMSRVLQGGRVAMYYIYNGKGEQVARTPTGTFLQQVFYNYDESGHLAGVYDFQGNRTQEVIWLDNLPVGVVVGPAATGKLHYIQPDHLGTPRTIIEPIRQKVVWTWALEGEAFGSTAPNQDADGDGQQFVFDLRFPGQRFDAASGLNQNMHREYEPGTGRYSQSDPSGIRGGLASFTYASSGPMQVFDSWGLAPERNFFAPSDPLHAVANRYNSPAGTFTITGHGDPTGQRLLKVNDRWIKPEAVWELIREEFLAGGYRVLRIAHCSAGLDDEEGTSVAEALSSLLPRGARVEATPHLVGYPNNGNLFPGVQIPSLREGKPALARNSGMPWSVYANGVQVSGPTLVPDARIQPIVITIPGN